jgi:hypothetical protein
VGVQVFDLDAGSVFAFLVSLDGVAGGKDE